MTKRTHRQLKEEALSKPGVKKELEAILSFEQEAVIVLRELCKKTEELEQRLKELETRFAAIL